MNYVPFQLTHLRRLGIRLLNPPFLPLMHSSSLSSLTHLSEVEKEGNEKGKGKFKWKDCLTDGEVVLLNSSSFPFRLPTNIKTQNLLFLELQQMITSASLFCPRYLQGGNLQPFQSSLSSTDSSPLLRVKDFVQITGSCLVEF